MASGFGGARSTTSGVEPEETALDCLQFGEDIRHLIAAPPENTNSFTALLELPPNQAMELLHSPDSHHKSYQSLTFPTNSALLERAARFSVFAHNLNNSSYNDNNNGNENYNYADTSSNNSSANLVSVTAKIVKSEPETESSSRPLGSDPTVEDNQRPSGKRKERERKVNKGSTKKTKTPANDSSLPYVHVRARSGQATDSHSLAERARREKINARMKLLQELVPGCDKVGGLAFVPRKGAEDWGVVKPKWLSISGTALVLDEIINHVQSLQRQVEFLSMRLAAVNPRIDINLDSILAADSGSLMDSNFPSMVMPLMWPEIQVNENKQQYQQRWLFDGLHQPVWRTEEDSHNFITPENSLLSYDSSTNSASLRSNQLKMEEI